MNLILYRLWSNKMCSTSRQDFYGRIWS